MPLAQRYAYMFVTQFSTIVSVTMKLSSDVCVLQISALHSTIMSLFFTTHLES